MEKPSSKLAQLAVSSLVVASFAGCYSGGQRSANRQPVAGYGAPMHQPSITEAAAHPQQLGSLPLFLPGSTSQQVVNFQVVNGMAVFEGDIMLGPVSSLPMRYGWPKVADPNIKSAVAVSNQSFLWPGGVIPYVIDTTVTPEKREYIAWAIARINETELEMRPRSAGDADYVNFNGAGSGCTSYVGRVGGSQEIQVADCGRGSVIHEIMHAAGFYHEQCRADRDDHVTIVFDEIVPSYRNAFEKRGSRSQDIGAYDYGSIMHYSSTAFSKSGKPTIIPRDPNAQIGQRDGLSPLDRAAITHLYGTGTQPPGTQPPGTQPPGAAPPGAQPAGFGGSYTSERGDVTCTQSGVTVTCQYPGGSMICAARDQTMDCGWSGGGQGRATFARQSNGVLTGSWGDFFSNNSRGSWNLVPMGSGKAPPGATPPGTPPVNAVPLSGSYSSSRGPMTCVDSGSTVVCDFQEGSAVGRLSCAKDASGMHLSCNWATFFPMPGMGRASLSRGSTSDRNLSGTWGRLTSTTDGGQWDAQAQ